MPPDAFPPSHDPPPEPAGDAPRRERAPSPANLAYRIAASATTAFVITILALVANLLGDPTAPAAQWLDKNVMTLLVIEIAVIIIAGLLGMAGDKPRQN